MGSKSIHHRASPENLHVINLCPSWGAHSDWAWRKCSHHGQMGMKTEDTLLIVPPFIKQTNPQTPWVFAFLYGIKGSWNQVPSGSGFPHPTAQPLAVTSLQLLGWAGAAKTCLVFACGFHANLRPKGYWAVPPPSPLMLHLLDAWILLLEHTLPLDRDDGIWYIYLLDKKKRFKAHIERVHQGLSLLWADIRTLMGRPRSSVPAIPWSNTAGSLS